MYSASLMKREIQKTLFTKNSVKFIDFAEPQRPRTEDRYWGCWRSYTLTVLRSMGRLVKN